jgi:hypothetical protein
MFRYVFRISYCVCFLILVFRFERGIWGETAREGGGEGLQKVTLGGSTYRSNLFWRDPEGPEAPGQLVLCEGLPVATFAPWPIRHRDKGIDEFKAWDAGSFA